MKYITAFMGYIKKLFHFDIDEQIIREPFSFHKKIEEEICKVKVKKQPVKRNAPVVSEMQLSNLLDGLDKSFDRIKYPTADGSHTNKDTISGLKKMGACVFHSYDYDRDAFPIVKNPHNLSAMMFVSTPSSDDGKEHNDTKGDLCMLNFLYAIKIKKIPYNVEQAFGGTLLQCGCAARYKKKIGWLEFYAQIKPNGEIRLLNELAHQQVIIPNKWKTTYVKRVTCIPAAHVMMNETEDERRETLKHYVASCINLWNQRKENWNISVTNGKDKLTFCIPDNKAKYFFKDREKTAVSTIDGKRKPIMHICHAHDRKVNDKIVPVKEHIKGLREFLWKKYKCKINAPEFHFIPSVKFDIASEVFDDTDVTPKGWMGLARVGAMLASIEHSKTVH